MHIKTKREYWHQESRNTWYSSGNLNTKVYHALIKKRRVRDRIVGLHDAVGELDYKGYCCGKRGSRLFRRTFYYHFSN